MKLLKSYVALLLLVSLLLSVVPPAQRAAAAEAGGMPVKVIVITDEESTYTARSSDFYQSVRRALSLNKIPFDTLDVFRLDEQSLFEFGELSRPKYSAIVLLAAGWRIAGTKNKAILDAASKGTGVVGLTTDVANTELMSLFGIQKVGTDWVSASAVHIRKDKITVGSAGTTVGGSYRHLDHKLAPDVDVIAEFDVPGEPAIWSYRYGPARTVYHNHTEAWSGDYLGLVVQSILYTMPVGVASPVNVGVIEFHDAPRGFTSDIEAHEWYQGYYSNLKRWLQTYNFKASFFTTVSYTGNVSDFWLYDDTVEWAADVIRSGYELGLHGGPKHTSLNIAHLGLPAALNNEVMEMAAVSDRLRNELATRYGVRAPDVVSYAAPGSPPDKDGYQALASLAKIKYVSSPGVSPVANPVKDIPRSDPSGIYVVPITNVSFYQFAWAKEGPYSPWNILRSVMESGDAYVVCTNPDEPDVLDQNQVPKPYRPELFEWYTYWADGVVMRYPQYRWWTLGQLGQYLQARTGNLEAEWIAQHNVLKVKPAQQDDVIHIKTTRTMTEMARVGDSYFFTFGTSGATPTSSTHEILRIGGDYYVNPIQSRSTRSVTPQKPFVVMSVAAPPSTPDPVESIVEGARQEEWPMRPFMTIIAGALLLAIGIFTIRAVAARKNLRGSDRVA